MYILTVYIDNPIFDKNNFTCNLNILNIFINYHLSILPYSSHHFS